MDFDEKELQIIKASASASDAADILRIQKLAFHRQAVLYDDFALPPLVQTLDELIQDFDKYTFLKAVYNGSIIGSVRGGIEGDTCFISRLIVHPEFQNRGLGKMLMRAIEFRFGLAQRYVLYTGHKSIKNLALYAKLGYREFSRKPQSDKVMLINLEKRNGGNT